MEREEAVTTSVGDLLGPAVARSFDMPIDDLVGPASNVALIIDAGAVRVVHRHPGGRLGADLCVIERSGVAVEPLATEHTLVLSGPEARVAFRPVDPADVDRLARELRGGATDRGAELGVPPEEIRER